MTKAAAMAQAPTSARRGTALTHICTTTGTTYSSRTCGAVGGGEGEVGGGRAGMGCERGARGRGTGGRGAWGHGARAEVTGFQWPLLFQAHLVVRDGI